MPQALPLNPSVAALLRVAGLVVAYFVTAKLPLLAATPPGYATALGPSSGIAIAALVLLGPRYWTGIWLGAALVNVTVHASLLAAVFIATGNTIEALVGAALLRNLLHVPSEFRRGRDVSKFVGIAILSATFAATFAAIPLSIVHGLSWHELYLSWSTWWLGDTMGIILVAPLILSWGAPAQQAWPPLHIVEFVCLATGLLLISLFIFTDVTEPYLPALPMSFMVLPFIIWAAFRFRQREVTTLVAAASAIAIIFTTRGNGPFAVESLNLSLTMLLVFMSTLAATGLVLNAVVRERARKLDSLNEALHKLQSQVVTDPLTGLFNRRFLDDYLERELARAVRSKHPVAIIMLDLDHFKRINDQSGHAAGDAVLAALGALLRRHFRASDVACRYGGEEFVLVMPETGSAAACRKAEQVRIEVERARESLLGVTASLGVAVYPEHGSDAEALIRAADAAMYDAKEGGRNRIAICTLRAGG